MTYLTTVVLLLANLSAYADIPPPHGSSMSETIQGTAASILAASIGGKPEKFPAELSDIRAIDGTAITEGYVRTTSSAYSDTKIGCATYYYRGHNAICKLYEVYK